MKRKKVLPTSSRYTEEQLETLKHYELWQIAVSLGVQRREDGSYGTKSEVIPKILEAQQLHGERVMPYCEMCGNYTMLREKAHICSEGDVSRENILMLCASCHRMLDVHLKPRLYIALNKFGAKRLPESWERSIYEQAPKATGLSKPLKM